MPFWLDGLKTLIGAFVGAAFAFSVTLIQQHRQRRRDDLAAGNLANFILCMHFNTLHLLQREMAPHRAFPMTIAALEHVLPPETYIDIKSMSFLIAAGEAQLLGEISVAEDTFRSMLASLHSRIQLLVDEV